MSGSLLTNLTGALLGFAIAFFSSWSANTFETSIIRATIAFFVLFVLIFPLRMVFPTLRSVESSLVHKTENKQFNGVNEQSEEQVKQASAAIKALLKEDAK
ncbi:hypothetical protein [Thalassobacillus hwangdonensis]|uniref:Uncharacterized protein n=1 Tax=Thalassobacillus hwangdonensis TaxID=546108 RepID=A0ABW3KYJ7_9BACI